MSDNTIYVTVIIISILWVSCSTNPRFATVDESGLKRISLVPNFPKDILEVSLDKKIDGEIYIIYQLNTE